MSIINKQAFAQYYGIVFESHKKKSLDSIDAAHMTVSDILTEVLEINSNNNSYNLYTCKPIIRATIVLLKQRLKEIEPHQYKPTIDNYKYIINYLEQLTDAITKDGVKNQ